MKLKTGFFLVITLLAIGANTPGATRGPQQDQPMKVTRQVAPVYPDEAKRAQVEGNVVLDVTVEENGEVSVAKVVNGHQLLQKAAVDAAMQWRFANPGDAPVTIQLTMAFSLKADSAGEKKPTPVKDRTLTNTHKVDAVYPEEAKRQRIHGEVAVEIQVDENGRVTDARAQSGHEVLRKPAVDAARQFRFSNDLKAPVAATLTFNFVLENKK